MFMGDDDLVSERVVFLVGRYRSAETELLPRLGVDKRDRILTSHDYAQPHI